jgi:hypothetical protein
MGLAPYGEPVYADLIRQHLVKIFDDGSIWMDQSYYNYAGGLTMTSKKFDKLFEGPPRRRESPITRREMNLAASVQVVTEEIMLKMAHHAHQLTGMKQLCLAGGVALNCVGNGRLLREGPFEDLWVQPASGDAGGALGAALFTWYQLLEKPRAVRAEDSMEGSYLGPQPEDAATRSFLEQEGAKYRHLPDEGRLCEEVAGLIAAEKVVGWVNGRMERKDADPDEREDQIPGIVPALRTFGDGGKSAGVVRDRAASPEPLHADRGASPGKTPARRFPERGRGPGPRQGAPLLVARHHPRGLFGALADGERPHPVPKAAGGF